MRTCCHLCIQYTRPNLELEHQTVIPMLNTCQELAQLCRQRSADFTCMQWNVIDVHVQCRQDIPSTPSGWSTSSWWIFACENKDALVNGIDYFKSPSR